LTKAAVQIANIPMGLIMNWEHTGVNIVLGYQWTMTEKGTKQVGAGDVMSDCICATASGNFLPFQVIYQGKTPACLPRFVMIGM